MGREAVGGSVGSETWRGRVMVSPSGEKAGVLGEGGGSNKAEERCGEQREVRAVLTRLARACTDFPYGGGLIWFGLVWFGLNSTEQLQTAESRRYPRSSSRPRSWLYYGSCSCISVRCVSLAAYVYPRKQERPLLEITRVGLFPAR